MNVMIMGGSRIEADLERNYMVLKIVEDDIVFLSVD